MTLKLIRPTQAYATQVMAYKGEILKDELLRIVIK